VLQVSLICHGETVADNRGFGGAAVFQGNFGNQGGGGPAPNQQPGGGGQAMPILRCPARTSQDAVQKQSKELRSQSAQEYNRRRRIGGKLINDRCLR